MEAIFLTRSDIFNLPKIKYDPDWTLYKLDNDTLLKCFNVRGKAEEEKSEFLYTKGNKINYISNYDMPENNFKAFVFVDGRLVGYTYENVYKKGYRKLSYLDYKSSKKKLDILKQAKEHIFNLHDVGIVYGNIVDDNILYNPTKNRILLSNMDEVKVKNYDFDVKNVFMYEYLKNNPKNPMLLDNYMFNLYIVAYLDRVFYPSILDYLQMGKIPEELDNGINNGIINEMLNIDKDYSGRLLIDNAKPITRNRTK